MRGREPTKPSSAPTDLLVCFPTRAHLTAFMPKPICSPARLQLPDPGGGHIRQPLPRRGMKKSGSTTRRGQTSPALWAKTTKQMGPGPIVSEPTSPKVTCAGQIKVKPRIGGGRSWQSVMEEIEKIHNNGKSKSRRPIDRARESSSGGGFINKEVMQFLTCLRNVRLNFRCFGAFPGAGTVSDDEDEEEEDAENCGEEEEEEEEGEEWEENSKAVFSKWFMVLQETKETKANRQPEIGKKRRGGGSWDDSAFAATDSDAAAALPPPSNALLLMRCRSAPAKTVAEEKAEEQLAYSTKAEDRKLRSLDDGKKKLRLLIDEEKKEEEKERKKQQQQQQHGFLMETYDIIGRHCKFSAEIAKETWVLGGTRDTLPRSWSSKS